MRIRHYRGCVEQHIFNFCARHTVFAALGPIPIVPIKSGSLHAFNIHKCVYKFKCSLIFLDIRHMRQQRAHGHRPQLLRHIVISQR